MYVKRLVKNISYIGFFILASAAEPALANAYSGNVLLASNNEVLAAWQQSAQDGGATPELVKQDDGGTKIEWHGGVTLNKYTDTASGGELLTSQTTGDYYKADVNSDLRAISPDGNTSFAQFSLTNTNDRSVLTQHDTQINTLVVGRTGQGYDIRFGDTALDLSRLAGSTGGMRGMQAQKQLGSSTLISVAAGVLTPSWEELEKAVPRTQYLRDAYAAKLEQALSESTRLFVIQEGYSDDQGSLDSTNASLLAAARASVTTGGFVYQKNSLNVTGEAATSRWKEVGQNAHNSGAYALDANWTGQSYGLYGGYHFTGLYYTSLPGQAQPGLREAFVGGNWTAASWLALTADLRRSENKTADTTASGPSTATSTPTDTAALAENITFGSQLPGLGLGLRQSVSDTKNSDGTHNKTIEYGANATYSGQVWNTGLGYDLNRIDAPATPTSSGKTETWTANLGLNFPMGGDAMVPPVWTASMNMNGTLQHYTNAGMSTRGSNYNLQMNVQRAQWFILNASYGEGFTTSPVVGGATVRTRIYSVSAAHPFGSQNSIRFYLNNNGTIAGDPTQIYSVRQVGAELIYQL
jgi:hypothetical protein